MKKAGITLRLGAMVIYFNTQYFNEKHYANEITYRLKVSINRHLNFSRLQKKHLHTYFLYKLKRPEDIASIKEEIATLNANKRRSVRRILVNIVFADKKVTRAKKDGMAKLYAELGFNEAMLIEDLNAKGLSGLNIEEVITAGNVVKVDFSAQAKKRRLHATEIQALQHSLALLSKAMQTSTNTEKHNHTHCHTHCDVIPLIKHKK